MLVKAIMHELYFINESNAIKKDVVSRHGNLESVEEREEKREREIYYHTMATHVEQYTITLTVKFNLVIEIEKVQSTEGIS